MSEPNILSDILLASGITAAGIFGLAAVLGRIWMGRVLVRERSNMDVKLRLLQSELDGTKENPKSELDKDNLIHKVQFEKEFSIYEQIWESLIEVKYATLSLQPSFDYSSDDEEAERSLRLERLINSFREYGKAIDANRPFYAENVFAILERLWKVAQREGFDYSGTRMNNDYQRYWDRANRNRENILNLVDKCCSAIRARIGFVKVM